MQRNVIVLALILFFSVTTVCAKDHWTSQDIEYKQLRQELRSILDEKLSRGCNVKKDRTIKDLVIRSRENIQFDPAEAISLLRQAIRKAKALCTDGRTTTISAGDASVIPYRKGGSFPETLVLSIPADCIKITEAIPVFDPNSPNDHPRFKQEIQNIQNDRLELPLKNNFGPVYVEPCTSPGNYSGQPKSIARADSPFGIVVESEVLVYLKGEKTQLQNVRKVGAKWVRMSGRAGILWDAVERPPLGRKNYDWDDFDQRVKALKKSGFNILCTIKPFNSTDQASSRPTGRPPVHWENYARFIQDMAERYDGDGIADCPGGWTVDCWQVHNEVDAPHFWKGTAAEYAELFRVTADALKKAAPGVMTALAGISSPDAITERKKCNYKDILRELQSKGARFDVFDAHLYKDYRKNPFADWTLAEFMEKQLPAFLTDYGFGNTQIWFTEVGSYSGSSILSTKGILVPQSEQEQAMDVLRRYVHFLANGVDKVFWFSMCELHWPNPNGADDYFSNMGLVYNGIGNDDRGRGVKKSGFFTYQFMTEKLETADWKRVERVYNGQHGIFCYKIPRPGQYPIWVIWTDSRDYPLNKRP